MCVVLIWHALLRVLRQSRARQKAHPAAAAAAAAAAATLRLHLRCPPHPLILLALLLPHNSRDSFTQGSADPGFFRLWHWESVDTFVYFSHWLVTVPPPGWIAAAHRNGVKVGEAWREVHVDLLWIFTCTFAQSWNRVFPEREQGKLQFTRALQSWSAVVVSDHWPPPALTLAHCCHFLSLVGAVGSGHLHHRVAPRPHVLRAATELYSNGTEGQCCAPRRQLLIRLHCATVMCTLTPQ